MTRRADEVDGGQLEGDMEDHVMGETSAEERGRLVVRGHTRRERGKLYGADEEGHGWIGSKTFICGERMEASKEAVDGAERRPTQANRSRTRNAGSVSQAVTHARS